MIQVIVQKNKILNNMRKVLSTIFILLLLISMASCEKDLPLYSDTTCRLNFYYNLDNTSEFKPEMALSSYSFVYGDPNIKSDTLWFDIQSMGFVSDQDRPIEFAQVDTTANMAISGKHYVAFNDPSIASYYKMPAGKAITKIPVVLLRDESLKDTSVVLKFCIKDNGYFTKGYDSYQTRIITFTDRMAEPSKWTYNYSGEDDYTFSLVDYFGTYGVVKHKFLIEHTGKKWDNDYIEQFMTGDSDYRLYIQDKMITDLETLNSERAAQGLGELSESDGTIVSFYN